LRTLIPKERTKMDHTPLASRMRPQTLEDVVGQAHLLGKNQPLQKIYADKNLFSMILWGPPGVGKTTIARILASQTELEYVELSAVSTGKSEIKEIVQRAEAAGKPIILFLDEIHRFNKAQQDFLLPSVESGTLILIGATTENPSFEVISPLLSRCRVYVLQSLTQEELGKLIENAEQFLLTTIDKESRDFLMRISNGDARQLISIIDHTFSLFKKITIEHLNAAMQDFYLRYDTNGEEHFNTISAFIKSMRASNVDAALYYLARMVHAGEDPKFIARRMVIFASEDIGIAVPTALVVANEVFRTCETIGYPECQINLAHGTVYLCTCKKDRSAYDAYFKALDDVKSLGNLPIPLHLRNAPTKLMKSLDYGKGYEMYPDKEKSLLPKELKNAHYYSPKQ